MFDIETEELSAFCDVREELLHEFLACGNEGVAGEGLGKSLYL